VHDVLTIAMCLAWLVLVICTSIAFTRHEIFFEQDPLPSKSTSGKALGLKPERPRDAQGDAQHLDSKARHAEDGNGIELREGVQQNDLEAAYTRSTETTAHERGTTSLYQRGLVGTAKETP